MNNKQLVDLCTALFPELPLIFNKNAMEKDPETCKRVTALHLVATGKTKGKEYVTFQAAVSETHLPLLHEAKRGRAEAEKNALREGIKVKRRAAERQSKRTGQPVTLVLNEAEAALEAEESTKA